MKRLLSIDATRGLVMLLMLLDHSREFFYLHAQVSDPVVVSSTDPALFFSRLLAHFCAPVFVALTGLAASLHFQKHNSLKNTSEFLWKRGLILIILELTIINFGWTFSLTPRTLFLQVIWAIGISMVIMSLLIKLPRRALFAIGLTLIMGHNILDPISFQEGEAGHILWAIIHDRSLINVTDYFRIRTSYPVLPWIGVMALGYCIGPWFSQKYSSEKRRFNLGISSATCMGLFILMRLLNDYGDAYPWKSFENPTQTVMSFLNLTKYPPSADFLLFTLSVGLLFMFIFERMKGRLVTLMADFGSVPMFYYIAHIYLLNLIHTILKYFLGPNQGEFLSVPSVIYLWIISALIAVPMWFLCKWYAGVKKKYPNSFLKFI